MQSNATAIGCEATPRSLIALSRPKFLIFQALNIAAFSSFIGNLQPGILLLSGFVSILLYGLLLYTEVMSSQWSVTPLLCYGTTSLLRVGGSAVFLASIYMSGLGEAVQFVRFDPHDYIMQGQLLLLVGDWFFLAGYFAAERLLCGKASTHAAIPRAATHDLLVMGILLVSLSWGIRIASLAINLNALGGGPGKLMGFSMLAGILFLLIARDGMEPSVRVVWTVIVLAVVGFELAAALKGYMKQNVIRTLLPVGVYYFQRISIRRFHVKISLRRLLPVAVLAYFIVMVLFPYVAMRRGGRYRRFADTSVRTSLRRSLSAAIPCTQAFYEVHRFPTEGYWTFFTRNEWTSAAAWAVHRVEVNGTISGKTLMDGFTAIVPRIVWSEKPRISPGRDFAVLLGQAKSFETATTCTGLGLAATFYWNGGPLLAGFGMFVAGALLAATWMLIRRRILINPMATIIYSILVLESFRWFEGAFDGGLSFYAYIYIVFVPLMLLLQLFFFSEPVYRRPTG